MIRNYDIFSGHDLEVADKILRLRLRLLVHSCIYYKFDQNIISDMAWDKMAKELVQLQKDYPEISNKVEWYEAFSDWDGSTGAFLPLDDPWVIRKARLFVSGVKSKPTPKPSPSKVTVKKSPSGVNRLF